MLCGCDNIWLVSLILMGWELRILYHCTMCTRHPDLVSLDFYAIPIFHIRISTFEFLHLFVVSRSWSGVMNGCLVGRVCGCLVSTI